MADFRKIDAFFNGEAAFDNKEASKLSRRAQILRWAKLLMPSLAAVLIALLLLFPSLKDNDVVESLDVTLPKKGELEKLHMEQTEFSITDKDYLARMRADSSDLFAGNKIKLRLADGNVFAKEGTFRFTGNEIDRPTSSLSVYADFENADRKLLANAYVDVLIERDYADGILLPQTSVSMEAKGNYVFVISRGVLEKKAVDIISNTGGSYLVKNVFAPGDYVVTDKISRFTPGQKARVRVEDQARQLQTAEKK